MNPFKLRDLQCVLEMRCFSGLLSDEDLIECYFKRAWGFSDSEFVLVNWREMSAPDLRNEVQQAYASVADPIGGNSLSVVESDSVEEVVKKHRHLIYIPREVFLCAVGGAGVLRAIKNPDGLPASSPRDARQVLFNRACYAGGY
jgi:hypothetical protein